MPILPRTHRPAVPDAVPAVQAARVSRAWPATMVLFALIVFTIFWAQTSMLAALIMALVTAVAGSFLLTLMFGTAWITRRRRRTAQLRRYR